MLDLQSRIQILTSPLSSALGKLLAHVRLVTKQCNLVPANGRWCLAAGR